MKKKIWFRLTKIFILLIKIEVRRSVNSIEVEYLPSKQMARVRFPVNAEIIFIFLIIKLKNIKIQFLYIKILKY